MNAFSAIAFAHTLRDRQRHWYETSACHWKARGKRCLFVILFHFQLRFPLPPRHLILLVRLKAYVRLFVCLPARLPLRRSLRAPNTHVVFTLSMFTHDSKWNIIIIIVIKASCFLCVRQLTLKKTFNFLSVSTNIYRSHSRAFSPALFVSPFLAAKYIFAFCCCCCCS